MRFVIAVVLSAFGLSCLACFAPSEKLEKMVELQVEINSVPRKISFPLASPPSSAGQPSEWTSESVKSISGASTANRWAWSRPSEAVLGGNESGRESLTLSIAPLEKGEAEGRAVGISGIRTARALGPDTLSRVEETLTIYFIEAGNSGLVFTFVWRAPQYTGRQGINRSLDAIEADEINGLRFIQALRSAIFNGLKVNAG